jgi:hypothetical protein
VWLLISFLDGRLERRQRAAPESVEFDAQRRKRVWIDAVDATGTRRRVRNQPSILEHPKVMRHSRPTDRQLTRQLYDRTRAIRQQRNDRLPRWIAERYPRISSVNSHER